MSSVASGSRATASSRIARRRGPRSRAPDSLGRWDRSESGSTFRCYASRSRATAMSTARHTRGTRGVRGATCIRDGCPATGRWRCRSSWSHAATDPDPHGWRAGAFRVLANALLVLLAYEVVSLVLGVAQVIVTGPPPGLAPVELVLVLAAFLLVRWIFVLPGLLLVLVGIEFVARRAPHARVLTAIVACAPMVWWQVTQSSGDTSGFSVVLGVIAVLFAVLARLPARFPRRPTEDRGAAQPPRRTCGRSSLTRTRQGISTTRARTAAWTPGPAAPHRGRTGRSAR